jgi:hypothetical protein
MKFVAASEQLSELSPIQTAGKLFALAVIVLMVCTPAALARDLKPRVIVLTDIKRHQEPDDSQSLVRLLSLADLVEVEGIVVSAGFNYWEPRHAVEGYAYTFELLEAYRQSVGNLMKMSDQAGFLPVEEEQEIGYWPSPNYVVQRTVLGTTMQGLDQTGPGKDNAGSRLITNVVDEADPRPVYILAWGGANVLAQTMRDITENPLTRREPAAVGAFVRKIRVIAVGDQDQPWPMRAQPPISNNAGSWLRKQFPNMHWILVNGTGFHQATRAMQPFYQAHIQGHGALGDAYPDHNHSIEGDTSSLFHVLPLGIADLERPDWGSAAGIHWYGRHDRLGVDVWARPSGPDSETVLAYSDELASRCTAALWRLFAARMDWARSGTGNRPPVVVIDGDAGRSPLVRKTTAGQTVTLDASRSRDGENDRLRFSWECMQLKDSFQLPLLEEAAASPQLSFQVPAQAASREIHLLLTVSDSGAGHALCSWRRVVLQVAPNAHAPR